MSKNKGNSAVAEVEISNLLTSEVGAANYTLTMHRADHPGNRSGYSIPGHPGNMVIFNSLFKDGVPPATLTLNVELVAPKADNKQAKLEAQALKAAEKIAKAQAKAEAAAAKVIEKQEKAAAALAAAQAKVEEAKAAAAAKLETPA